MTYICAQHERPGFIGFPAFIVPIDEAPVLQPPQGLPKCPARNLRLQGERSLCFYNADPILDYLAVAPSGFYQLEVHIPGRCAAHALPLGSPEAALQVLDGCP